MRGGSAPAGRRARRRRSSRSLRRSRPQSPHWRSPFRRAPTRARAGRSRGSSATCSFAAGRRRACCCIRRLKAAAGARPPNRWASGGGRSRRRRPHRRPAAAAATGVADIAGVRLTHPDRLLWAEGVSKQALAEFYGEIAARILPHIAGRVLSAVRAPSGSEAKSFYARHPWAGLAHVRAVDVGEKEPMLAIDDIAGLIGLVQGGTVEIHPWGSRVDDIERPDRLLLDLD